MNNENGNRLLNKKLNKKGTIDKLTIWCIFIFYFLLIFILNANLSMYGDDYWYISYTNNGFINCIIDSAKLYLTVNGRLFPNIYTSVLLYFGFNIFKYVNSFFYVLLLYLLFNIITTLFEVKNKPLLLLLLSTMIISMDVLILQESVLWLTGSFNYFYPITFVLLNFFLIIKYRKKSNDDKFKYLLIITTFLSSFLVEQSAIGNAMLLFGILIYDFIFNHRKIDKNIILCFAMTIIAFGFIYFSPGCQSRVENETTISGIKLISNNFKLILNLLFFYRPFQYLNLLTSILFCLYYLFNKKDKFTNVLFMFTPFQVYTFAYIKYKSINIGYFDINDITIYLKIFIYINLILFIINFINIAVKYMINKHEYILFSLVAFIYGGQVPMILVPTMGFRTTLVSYIGLIIYFSILFNDVIFSFKQNNNVNKMFFAGNLIVLLVCILIYNYSDLLSNYKLNTDVINSNDAILRNCMQDDYESCQKIYLKKVPLDNYRWTMPYDSDPHMVWYRKYYNIPEMVELIYEG